MRKLFNRRALIALTAALVLLLNATAALAEPTQITENGGTASTTISVTITDDWVPAFTITIPAGVTVPYVSRDQGSQGYFDITAEGIVDTLVEVRLGGINELKKADWVQGDPVLNFGIFNTGDFSDEENRGSIIGSGDILTTFDADGSDTICVDMGTQEWERAMSHPGTYTGTLVFTITATQPTGTP